MTADCRVLKMAILCYFQQRLLTKLIKIMCTKFSGIKYIIETVTLKKLYSKGTLDSRQTNSNEEIHEAFSLQFEWKLNS